MPQSLTHRQLIWILAAKSVQAEGTEVWEADIRNQIAAAIERSDKFSNSDLEHAEAVVRSVEEICGMVDHDEDESREPSLKEQAIAELEPYINQLVQKGLDAAKASLKSGLVGEFKVEDQLTSPLVVKHAVSRLRKEHGLTVKVDYSSSGVPWMIVKPNARKASKNRVC